MELSLSIKKIIIRREQLLLNYAYIITKQKKMGRIKTKIPKIPSNGL